MKQLSTVTKPKGSDRVRTANNFIQRFYDKDSKDLMSEWKINLSKNCLKIESS
jgi:aubergine-like protein